MQHLNSFIITKNCNMSCDYCYFRRPNIDEQMNFKQFLKFVKEIYSKSDKEIIRVMLFGGEPLMNWGLIVKICEFKKKLIKPLQIYIMTNGLLLDEEKIKYLQENQVVLSISYDGSGTNKHRKTSLVKDVQNHLHNVFNIYQKNHFQVAITWCLCEDGVSSLEKDVDYLMKHYGKAICNIDINPVDLKGSWKTKWALSNVMRKYSDKVCGYYCDYCIKKADCKRRDGKTRAVEVTHFSSDGKVYNDVKIKETMKK